MSFTKKPRPFETPPSALHRARVSVFSVARTVVLAALVVVAAAWALAQHHARALPPMLVPIQPTCAPSYGIDTGEMPAPEIVEEDGS